MLLGDKHVLAIELVPVVPSWVTHYEPERAAWAGLALWINGENLCAHVPSGSSEVREHFFVPLAPIADWLVRHQAALSFEEKSVWLSGTSAHRTVRDWGERRPPPGISPEDWEDERDGFWERHFLVAGGDGSRLPNVAFLRQDDQLVVTWSKLRLASPPEIKAISSEGEALIPWAAAEAALARFVEEVAAFLRGAGVTHYAWAQQPTPILFHQPAANAFEAYTGRPRKRLAELLEVDEKDVPDVLGLAPTSEPAASPLCQVFRDLPWTLSPGVAGELRALTKRIMSSGSTENWPRWRAIAADGAAGGETPEEAGQLAAQALRRALGLDGQPVKDTVELLSECGAKLTESNVSTGQERAAVEARQGGTPEVVLFENVRTATSWGKRFEMGRALGHLLVDPLRGGALGAASCPSAQALRRRRSGAFAAELLLPEDAIAERSGGTLDGAAQPTVFERLMHDYGVGARTAAQQMWNRGWISSESIRDELIDRWSPEAV